MPSMADPRAGRDAETDEPGGSRIPWSRALLLLAVAGPALWLGGVKPWVVPAFAVVVAGMLARRCLRTATPLRVPALWWLGLLAAGVTLLQCVPLPPGLLALLAPGLSETVAELTAGTELGRWNRLSIAPGQTALEAARVLALTGLFLASAQLSWRLVAAYVSLTGTVVAVVGLVQRVAGATAIYGVYTPRQAFGDAGPELGSPLLTSFVNPNHQSGLLLLGLFASAAMAVDLSARARETRGRTPSQRLLDRAYLAWGALAIQTTALVLSMSRAALLAAVVVAPLALALGVREPKTMASHHGSSRTSKLGLAGVVVVMLGLAATQGAWAQLATLADQQSFALKLRSAIEGASLLKLSPALGVGRGTFVDLFPLVDSEPSAYLVTHLESSPIAFVVEWGLAGVVLVVGVGVWWWRSFRANPSLARRLGLCGVLALAIQSGADFSLDYLGVAAPAVALAGALGPSAVGKAFPCRRTLGLTVLGLVVAEAVAIPAIPSTWSLRRDRDRALLSAATDDPRTLTDANAALAQTPLDPFVHLALARVHAAGGDWAAAHQRAEVAARLRPRSLDAQLLAAVAAAETDAPLRAVEHLRLGLEGVREPIPEALIVWLLARYPDAEELPAVAPEDPHAWLALARAIARESPTHARALASARTTTHPDDPDPLRVQAELALAERNFGLALHHTRLLVAARPHEAIGHKLRFDARLGLASPSQLAAAVRELEQAHVDTRLDHPDVVTELLVVALLQVGDAESLARAEELLDGLLAHRAKPETRQRREALAERVRARAGSQ